MNLAASEDDTPSRATDGAGPWRREPFRVFFPLGVVIAWLGIGHWLLYATGITTTYSCRLHGLVQVESFLTAFAVGFLFTALPRRTQSPPPSVAEMTGAALALVAIAVVTLAGFAAVAQAAYALLFALVLRFTIRRFVGSVAKRRPPAAFVLVPIAMLHGLAGAALIAASPRLHGWPSALRLGPLLVEQGVSLCLTMGVGSLVLPLMSGATPPADLGSSPAERRTLVAYAGAGLALFASFVLEATGSRHAAPLLRASVDAIGLAIGGATLRRPVAPGLHRQLAWLAIWMMPVGLAASGLLPDYRVPALHIVFIGGFGLLAFAVATHVSLSHLEGLETLARGRPPAVVVLGASLGLALAARLAADFSHTYFDHLAWAAGCWIVGTAVWLAYLGPRLLRPPRSRVDTNRR